MMIYTIHTWPCQHPCDSICLLLNAVILGMAMKCVSTESSSFYSPQSAMQNYLKLLCRHVTKYYEKGPNTTAPTVFIQDSRLLLSVESFCVFTTLLLYCIIVFQHALICKVYSSIFYMQPLSLYLLVLCQFLQQQHS